MPDTRSDTHPDNPDADTLRDAVALHLARHIGEAEPAYVDGDGWAGPAREPGPPVDVLICPPSGERRFAYVASSGCALRPLPGAPDDEPAGARRVEFVMAAPQRGEESADRDMLNLTANTVRQFAKLVHLQPVAVAPGHTVAFSPDPSPVFEGTHFVAFVFMDPRLPAEGFSAMKLDEGPPVRFFAPVPIHRSELDLAVDAGVGALSAALLRAGVTEMIDLERRPVPPPPGRRPSSPGWLWRIARRLTGRKAR